MKKMRNGERRIAGMILLGGVILTAGVFAFSALRLVGETAAAQPPQWTQAAGLGVSVPACSSSSASVTCSGSAPSVAVSWSYGGQHGPCGWANVSVSGGPSWNNQACSGSVTWNGAAVSTSYSYTVSFIYDEPPYFVCYGYGEFGCDNGAWIDPGPAQVDSYGGSFTTPTCIPPPPQTLSVVLSANPSSGTAPLNGVDLTATVSGTAPGTINYTFYCNRSDTGTNVTPGWAAKFDGTNENPKTVPDACNYSAAGTYTVKVIAERGAAPAAEARQSIDVSNPPPPPGPPSGPPPPPPGPPPPPAQCVDGVDNDGDGLIDFPNDPGCENSGDANEQSACIDGIDNDGDGKIDYPADDGCSSAEDNDEKPLPLFKEIPPE